MINKKLVYEKFKLEFIRAFPGGGNYDAKKIKAEFKTSITARRRFERISSLSDLLDILEKQLVIFPDRGILEPYKVIALALDQPRHDLAAAVDTTRMHLGFGPRLAAPAVPPPVPHHQVHQVPRGSVIPDDIVKKIAKTFDDAGGRDWENLATGLGYKLRNADRDKIRVRQGEVDRIDRQYSSMEEKLSRVFNIFMSRCGENHVFPNLLEHVCDILKSKDVFGFPFNRLAKQISP